jgi:hypothetical protein
MRPPGQRQPAPRRAGGQVEELGPLHPAHRQRSPSKTSARLSSSVPEPFLVGNQLRSTGLSGLPRAADLIRVVVGRGPRRSRPTPPRRRGRSRCASHPAPNAPRRAGRGSRPSSSAPRRQPRPMPRSGARHGTMPWLRWRAPREAGAAVRITSALERIESLRLARRAERSRDRLTCEATAGIVPEAATVAPAGVDESGASVPSYPLMR